MSSRRRNNTEHNLPTSNEIEQDVDTYETEIQETEPRAELQEHVDEYTEDGTYPEGVTPHARSHH
jgi:hypothetical protein